MSKPVITVSGATDAQGGALARRKLHPGVAVFSAWLAANKSRIPLASAV